MNPMSLADLKRIEPKKFCSECGNTKPFSQFPIVARGLKSKPGVSCLECEAKRKQPKKEPEIVGVSESKPLLKDLNGVKEAVEMEEDEPRTKECTVCRDFKELDEFDTNDKICEECVEEEKRLKRLKKHVEETDTSLETKYCNECNETKLLSEFVLKHGMNRKRDKTESDYKTFCKKCRDTKQNKITSQKRKYTPGSNKTTRDYLTKRALEIYNECPKWFKKVKIMAPEYGKRFDYATSTSLQHLNILVEKGILESIGRGKKKHYRLVPKELSGGYDEITNALPESKPKKELPKPMSKVDKLIEDTSEHQKTIEENIELKNENKELRNVVEFNIADAKRHYDNWQSELVKRDVLKRQVEKYEKETGNSIDYYTKSQKVEEDPITPEDLNQLEQIGIKYYPKATPEQRIVELADLAFSGAEEIVIYPKTNEIQIKMHD